MAFVLPIDGNFFSAKSCFADSAAVFFLASLAGFSCGCGGAVTTGDGATVGAVTTGAGVCAGGAVTTGAGAAGGAVTTGAGGGAAGAVAGAFGAGEAGGAEV